MKTQNPRLGYVRIKNEPLLALQLVTQPRVAEPTYHVYVCLHCGKLFWGRDAERRVIRHLHRHHGVTANHDKHYATIKLSLAEYMMLRSIVKQPYNKNLLLSVLKSSIQK